MGIYVFSTGLNLEFEKNIEVQEDTMVQEEVLPIMLYCSPFYASRLLAQFAN